MMNLNLRYILKTWWPAEKDFVYAATTNMNSDQQLTQERRLAIQRSARAFANWRDADTLPILYLSREQAENGIRPVSHAIYCIGLSLHYGYYDEDIVGVPREDARSMCEKLIRAVVGEHRSNHPESTDNVEANTTVMGNPARISNESAQADLGKWIRTFWMGGQQ